VAPVAELEKAAALERAADSLAGLRSAIAAYEAVLKVAPMCYRASASLAQLHLLLGDAYAETAGGKRECFTRAMQYAEAAMFANPAFRERVLKGEPTWEACDALGAAEMDAMLFWVNAVFYAYKDGQSGFGQVVNFRWIKRARRVMEHMTSVEAGWERGILHLTWGLYYLSVPESLGGDRTKSAECFEKAVKSGPDDLVHRWARAKYYCVKMGNGRLFREDLEWVLSRDVRRSPGNAAWNMFFIRDARRLLDNSDRYFRR
jgi:tetratricopeptide (TPR) repeat protein